MIDISRIERMPRGGPDASWLDRHLQTDVPEYTDRYDIPDDIKQKVIRSLDRMGERFGVHEKHARFALSLVADTPAPKILELGAGHGKLSAKILELHPSAEVTVSDLDPTSVHNIAAGPLGSHPRATCRVIDASAIDAPDGSYDLVVFAASFHHLPPRLAFRAIAQATRVGTRFLVIDFVRLRAPALLMLLVLSVMFVPLAAIPAQRPGMHDGFISMLRSYSRSAFTTLAKAADPDMTVEFIPTGIKLLPLTAVAFSRP